MGECADCHTMHNSQDNLPMRYDSGGTPLPQLLRDDCYGCHAQGGADSIVTVGSSTIPQVYHNGFSPDLAGGNFGYIDGIAGSGASDHKGHNIADLAGMGADGFISAPPGGISQSNHNNGGNITSAELRCAGVNGCHGTRDVFGAFPAVPSGITTAHHDNQSGSVYPGAGETRSGWSYRFLMGVQGYEDTDWQFTSSAADHNEYAANANPTQLGCAGGAIQSCHGAGGVRPPNGTISEFCATCHGNFHTLTVGFGDDSDDNSSGVGTGSSPWLRHPTDYSLPVGGEYAGHTTYSVVTPVGRLADPGGAGGVVIPGTDAVICLSCHVAHGSDYDDMLRFDYTLMDIGAGGGASGTGCFKCHTAKD